MRLLSLLLVLGLIGCQDKAAGGGATSSSAATGTAAPAQKQASPPAPGPGSAAPAAAAGAAGARLAADASGAIALSWKAVNSGSPKVSVSLVAGDQTIPVGDLDATSDDAPSGTVEACSMKNKGQESVFGCGGTPSYNFYTAKIDGGSLVVTRTTGVEGNPGSEKLEEVVRRATSATSLKATGPASPALYGNCRTGHVQRTADSPCLHKCLKGTECKAAEACKLIDITGSDGPHKVSACVPAGK